MDELTLTIMSQQFTITRESILAAIREYDDHHRVGTDDAGRKYAIRHAGKLYPPKHILSLATKLPRSSLSGGKGSSGANRVFQMLDFEIVSVGGAEGAAPDVPTLALHQAKLDAPIPAIESLMESLWSQKWSKLHSDLSGIDDWRYPGVYVLAYSDEDLEGKPVAEDRVFYVGMSHAGIRSRLGQFKAGIEDDKHHSAARRFLHVWAHDTPYKHLRAKKTFFVAAVIIPCIVSKLKRIATDLRKMGEVARLEYYVLAQIKEKVGDEPPLNKQ